MEDVIKAPIEPKRARGMYDSLSRIYDYLTLYEGGAKRRGLEVAGIQSRNRVLEVGFGTGQMLEKIMRKNDGGATYGIELSPKMLKKTWHRVINLNLSNSAYLLIGDASHIPFRDGYFEVIFNSYMLDLIDTPVINSILREFKRVLKPGGRLVLISISKGKKWYSNMKLYEWFYGFSPSVLGGCRPLFLEPMVKDAGFCNVRKEFLLAGHIMPSEIVYCERPKED